MRSSVLFLMSSAALVALSMNASAQLTDLQPGRNFTGSNQFGDNHSENIDPGDVDNDGDMDVIVANGGDSGPQPNRIYVNNGGLQAGTVGTFTEGTAARFAGVPNDTSRDIEFVDIESDGDLDIYVSNRGTTGNGGEPSRFYTNQGGVQPGTIGFYAETTNTRWGTLISVPAGDQVLGGNAGPFRDHTCDCDFADLDDDGDTDLFHSSYGPNINATKNSLIFLNNGSGVFNEQWPWANATADITTHSIDLDLVDMDGDFDIDIFMSSRNSQARTYMNNITNPVGAAAYQDITQTALINTGATLSGQNNYTAEYGDIDGDGDFDQWMKNYDGNVDRILINNGFVAGVGYNLTKKLTWIKGDPNDDENEADFGDYDNDGDLDMFIANFEGTSWLYQSGLAQNLNADTQGLYHNTGFGGTGNLATGFPEGTFSTGQALDADWVDVDNDGDEDIIVAVDTATQPNKLYKNVLGVPDTHAPTFFKVTQQADKANGTSTVIHAQIRDNSSYYLTSFYPTELKYRVDNGSIQTISMFHQGSMQFRGVIPAQTDGFVQYTIDSTDLAGNTGTSAEFCYKQGAPVDLGTWTNLGFGLAGISGVPVLAGTGSLLGARTVNLNLSNAKPLQPAVLFIGLTNGPTNFKGGTLVPVPMLLTVSLSTSGSGTIPIPATWPSGLPSAFSIYFQYGIKDTAAVQGVSLSNALEATTP